MSVISAIGTGRAEQAACPSGGIPIAGAVGERAAGESAHFNLRSVVGSVLRLIGDRPHTRLPRPLDGPERNW